MSRELYVRLWPPAAGEVSLELCHNLHHYKKKSIASSTFWGISYEELLSECAICKIQGCRGPNDIETADRPRSLATSAVAMGKSALFSGSCFLHLCPEGVDKMISEVSSSSGVLCLCD